MCPLLTICGSLNNIKPQAEGKWHTANIKRVYPLADGGFVITFVTNISHCPSGGAEKYHYVRDGKFGVTQKGVDKMYGLALAAAAQGKKLNVYFDSSVNSCDVNRMSTVYN